MRTILYIISIAAMLAGGCISVGRSNSYRTNFDFSTLDKIAVVSIEGQVTSESDKNQISEFFAMELVNKGYAPIGRGQAQAFLSSQEPENQVDLTSPSMATLAGKILDVPAVLIVNVPNYNGEVTLTAQLINVLDGSTIWIGRDSGSTEAGKAESLFGSLTGASNKSSEYYLNQQMAMLAGEIVPEEVMTPDKAEKIQKIIKRICKSLPAKSSPKPANSSLPPASW